MNTEQQLTINEVWKDIPGYEGKYQISNTGKVLSIQYYGKCNYSKVLKFKPTKTGYLRAGLSLRGVITDSYIHRLVAQVFIPNPCNYKEVNHIDLNKSNNDCSNLEWISRGDNMKHAVLAGHITRDNSTGKINKYYR